MIDFDKIMEGVAIVTLLLLLLAVPVLVGFFIFREIHCWWLDPATAPIECQSTKTFNINN